MGGESRFGRPFGPPTVALVLLIATVVPCGGSTWKAAAGVQPEGAAVDLGSGSRAWIFSRLAEADALLRHGRPRAAGRAFQEVYVNSEGTQWATLAELGMAWSAATSGDLEMARALARDAHASAGVASSTSSVVFGLLSAKAGDHQAALESLDASLVATSQPSERNVIRLAKAYVFFWSGEFARAAAEFDAVAGTDHGGLVDDARYGAAWSRFKAGERTRAIADLTALVQDAPAGFHFRPVSRRLVELDERAILGDHARRYRRGGMIQDPDAQLARLLDSDGFSRARSALKLLDAGSVSTDAPHPQTAPAGVAADAEFDAVDGVHTVTRAASGGPAPVSAVDGGNDARLRRNRWVAAALLLVFVILSTYVARTRHRQRQR